jgi:hypothetical protein
MKSTTDFHPLPVLMGKLHLYFPCMLSLLDMQLYFYLLLHVTGIAVNCISSCHLSSLSSLLTECNICHWKHGTRNVYARRALFKQLTETGEQIPNAASSLEVI